MIQAIQTFFLEIVGPKLCVFFCSMLPIIELRGGIPLGAALGLSWYESFGISIVGNLIPVPFILFFIRAVLRWMQGSKIKLFRSDSKWLNAKAEKNKDKVTRYAFWGLFLFVAVPFPGTGAWTGSLVAAVCHFPIKRSLLAVFLGVLSAAVIMTLASYGILGFLKFLV